jgi:NOL1/NOP2/fmu family ribosome biogenesis protein
MEESREPGDFTLTGSIPWDSSWPRLEDEDERRVLFSYLEERFGIPQKTFADFHLFSRRKSWWLLRKTIDVLPMARLKVSQVGLKAFVKVGKYLKPTTGVIQILGHHATKGVHRLTDNEFERLLRGEPIEIDIAMEDGFVILCFLENVLGIGLLMQGKITSRIRQSETHRMVAA